MILRFVSLPVVVVGGGGVVSVVCGGFGGASFVLSEGIAGPGSNQTPLRRNRGEEGAKVMV